MSEISLIKKQAQQWLLLMLSEQVSFTEQTQFTQWIALSPIHKKIYFDCRAEHFSKKRNTNNRLRACLAIAATTLLAVLININLPAPLLQQSYAYQQHHNMITLPDGSTVEMKNGARFDISYSQVQRVVILNHGDAYFTVAKDKDRPFVVQYKDINITALGTAFYVGTHTHMQIQVTEHSIRVDSPYGKSLQLEEGTGKRLINDQWQSLSAEQLTSSLAWQDNMLIFSAEPLVNVLKELAIYLGNPINVMNPSLLKEKISGRFKTKSPELALAMIAEGSDFKVKKLTNGEILLY